ncbi:hypothetical protein PRO82_002047 [Candidatus Protochlamydia amoebophila]|nr:hypothetical protein [Candidatus Protochlamydia amoebophila]
MKGSFIEEQIIKILKEFDSRILLEVYCKYEVSTASYYQ